MVKRGRRCHLFSTSLSLKKLTIRALFWTLDADTAILYRTGLNSYYWISEQIKMEERSSKEPRQLKLLVINTKCSALGSRASSWFLIKSSRSIGYSPKQSEVESLNLKSKPHQLYSTLHTYERASCKHSSHFVSCHVLTLESLISITFFGRHNGLLGFS